MVVKLSEDSPLNDWTDNSDRFDEDVQEWENEKENVLIRIRKSKQRELYMINLFDTTNRPEGGMDHSWEYEETVLHQNTARAVLEEIAENPQLFLID